MLIPNAKASCRKLRGPMGSRYSEEVMFLEFPLEQSKPRQRMEKGDVGEGLRETLGSAPVKSPACSWLL